MPVAAAGLVRRMCSSVFLSFFSELTETRPYGTHVNWSRRHHTEPDNRKSRTVPRPRSDWGISPYQRVNMTFIFIGNPISTEEWSRVCDPTLSRHNSKMMTITDDRMTPHTHMHKL